MLVIVGISSGHSEEKCAFVWHNERNRLERTGWNELRFDWMSTLCYSWVLGLLIYSKWNGFTPRTAGKEGN